MCVYVCASLLICVFVCERARARERQHKWKTAEHIVRRNTQFAHTLLHTFSPFFHTQFSSNTQCGATQNFPWRKFYVAPHCVTGETGTTNTTHTLRCHTQFSSTQCCATYDFFFWSVQYTQFAHNLHTIFCTSTHNFPPAHNAAPHKNFLNRNYVCVVLLSSPTQCGTTHPLPRAPIIATESERAREIFLQHIMRRNTRLSHIFLHTFFSFFPHTTFLEHTMRR